MLTLRRLIQRNSPFLPSVRYFATPTMNSSVPDWTTVSDAAGRTRYDLFTKPLEKGQLDDREYRYIRLPNALEAVLISDSKADKAAAALNVGVGHLRDPVSYWRRMLTYEMAQACDRTTCQDVHISASIYCSWCAATIHRMLTSY